MTISTFTVYEEKGVGERGGGEKEKVVIFGAVLKSWEKETERFYKRKILTLGAIKAEGI